jgi:hypothetical protein
MDLKQRKLNRTEWNGIEVPVSADEMSVLNLIMAGYSDVNITSNKNNSIFTFLKIEFSLKMEDFIYNKYFRTMVDELNRDLLAINGKYKAVTVVSNVKLNSADKVRLDRFNEEALLKMDIYEFILLKHLKQLISFKKLANMKVFHFHYYSLYKLIRNNICHLNRHIKELVLLVLSMFEEDIDINIIIKNGVEFIERNDLLLKYNDMMLYEHQKEIFTIAKLPQPKLILYMAPTGTGKTMTPIALSQEKKIIFVCAARHVGLALARAAISVNKKIAFAFGCTSGDDIRLHYFAAKDYTRNKRSGGIGKVDNSVGDNVEIMICDIKSYLPAMYYMLAFFDANDIIMYWDEPTITLDYSEHEFHETIQKNWSLNKIPNIVLSSATLPKETDLTETLPDFLNKFMGGQIFNIVSHDCKKSIPIINKDGFVVLPHYMCETFEQMNHVADHCSDYLTLLRYFDLKEVVGFISYINENEFATARTNVSRYFETLSDINMKNIKMYYLNLIKGIRPENWSIIFEHFTRTRIPRIFENTAVDTKGNKITKSHSFGPGASSSIMSNIGGRPLTRLASEQIIPSIKSESITGDTKKGSSGVYVTTKDAYTLTNGPTIFISDNVEKIAKFCIQNANIPAIVMDDIMKKIDYNNVINQRLSILESESDKIRDAADAKAKNEVSGFHNGMKISGRNKSSKISKKDSKYVPEDGAESKGKLSKLTQEINSLRGMIKTATLNDTFVPNKKAHLEKWCESLGADTSTAFTSNIDEHIVSSIMALNGVDNSWKILLMMGIGVFINHENITYTEIMKQMADEQKLYMIIASSDYIYGTNYQFCHGFLSKDLNLTQEKIIQAIGRIGRNNVQQTYTIRFRDDEQIMKLFTSETDKPEIINMNRLFITKEYDLREIENIGSIKKIVEKEIEKELEEELEEELE